MFSKILKISIPLLLIGIILIIVYNTYQKTQDTIASPITIIPTNASVIIQLNDVKNISRSLKLYDICNKLQHIKQFKVMTQQADQLSKLFIKNQDVFTVNNLFVSFHKVSPKKSATLFSTNFKREWPSYISMNNFQSVYH